MKRFLLFLALMLSCIVPSLAQITSLSETNPAKSYTLTTGRSSLCAGATEVMSLASAGLTKDASDPRQQFAFVKDGDDYYLMSVVNHLYVSNTGLLVSTQEQAQPIYLENEMLKFDNTHVMNINTVLKLVIDDWTTKDAGNTYVIEEAADFDINAEPSLFVLNNVAYILESSSKTATILGASSKNITSAEIVMEIEYNEDTYTVSPSIPNRAFYGCTSLTSVTIPEGITSIGSSAFDDCTGLSSITIPNSVTSIGDYAFCTCSGLSSIVVEEGNPTYDSRENCNALIETASNTLVQGCKTTIIPNSVTVIGLYAFESCFDMTSITIPNGVTSIESYAFSGCSGLTSITIPSSVESIGDHAFSGCSGLTSVTIPSGVTSIEDGTFYNCSGMTSITLPNSVAHIGEWALSNTAITSIEIPTSMTYISGWTFASCSSLQSVNIPENIDSITFAAFQNCTSLREVTIPSGIKKLQFYTFTGCSSLVAVHCNALTPPALNDGLAIEVPANAVLYVPEESASAYKASAWRTYFSYINCEPIADGYYFITNPTRGANNAVYEDVSVNGTKWGSYTVPSDGNFHASDAKYVWKISMNSNGKYTLQNVLTGRYMNKANKIQVAIPTTVTATETFTIIPAERTTENEGHWILKNSSTATASDVSGYCSGVHAAGANNYVVQWGPSAPASHWDLIKLSEEDVTALESAMANKGSLTFEYTIDGRAWRSQTRLVDDLSEVTVPEQEFVTIVSTSDLTDLHDGDVVTVECEENLPFLVTTDEEAPIYGIIHGHSNQDRYIYVDDSGNGKDTGSAGDPENVNDNYLWYITGNLIDGFRLHNKAFDGATLKGTATIAKVNGTASDAWELRGAAKGSKFNNQEVFSLYQENVNYLNCQGSLKYWSANDEGSSFYFEPQPTEFVDGTEYTNGTSTKVGLLTYTRNFKNTNWQALYIPFSLDYEEWCDDFDIARVYNFIDYDDNDDGVFDRTYLVVQKKTSGSTEPNYPYLIRAKETGNKTLTLTDKTLEPAESNSIDCSSVDYIYTFTGSYTPVTDMYANGYYALSGGALNKANSASVVLGAQRWYMELTARGGCYTTRAQSIKIVVDGEDETEGIIAPSSSLKGESPVVYDLMGRGVKGAVKGISIVNGKKIIK